MESLGSAALAQAQARKALRRLRSILEEDRGRGAARHDRRRAEPRKRSARVCSGAADASRRRLRLIAVARARRARRARRVRQQGRTTTPGRDRGHLPRRRRRSIPGPDLAQLNPPTPRTATYLDGLRRPTQLAPDEAWFAVFVRVQNETDDVAAGRATDFTIIDTQGNELRPGPDRPTDNVFAYQPRRARRARACCRTLDSTASPERRSRAAAAVQDPDVATLDNRPLELEIHAPDGDQHVGDGQPRRLAARPLQRLSPAMQHAARRRRRVVAARAGSHEQHADRDPRLCRAGRERGEPGVGVGRVAAASRAAPAGAVGLGASGGLASCLELGRAGLAGDVDARDRGRACRCRSATTPSISRSHRARGDARRGRAHASRRRCPAEQRRPRRGGRRARSSPRRSPSAAPSPARAPGRSPRSRPRGRRRSPRPAGSCCVAAPGMPGGSLKPKRSAVVDEPLRAELGARAARRPSCTSARRTARACRRRTRRWRSRA